MGKRMDGRADPGRAATPHVNRALMALCVVVYALGLPPDRLAFVPAYAFGGGGVAGPLPTPALWIGLVAHPFAHADALHLATNLLVLWPLGDAVERAVGHGRFLLLFALGALAAAGLEGLLATDRMAPLIGASGAICALMGAFLWQPPRNGLWARSGWRWLAVVGIGAFAMVNAVLVIHPPSAGSPLAEVGWGAHLGGLLVGLALPVLWRR